jgi:hypothetical protein
MRRAGGQPQVPGEQVPKNGTTDTGQYNRWGDRIDIDHPLADCGRHCGAEYKKSYKVKKGCPDNCLSRRQNPGGNNGSNGVRGIMHSGGKIESQGYEDDKNYE